MTHIIIDGEHYDIPDKVGKLINENYNGLVTNYKAALELQHNLDTALHLIKEYKLRKETAREHRTKDMKIAAWKAERDLFSLVEKPTKQGSLFS